MQRSLETAPRGDARRSPASAPKKRLAILVSALGACLTPPSPANTAENTSSVALHYIPPAGPGSAFSLSYEVPPGFETAVLARVSPLPSGVAAEQSQTHPFGLSTFALIPLPVDRNAGIATLDGALPTAVMGQPAHQVAITLHLLLFQRATGECLVSGPIPLGAPAEEKAGAPSEAPAAQDVTDQSGSAAPVSPSTGSTAGQSAKGSASSGGGGTYASTSGRDNTEGSPYSKSGWGGILPGNAFLQLSPLLAISGAITVTLSHDQPAPVQGSGH